MLKELNIEIQSGICEIDGIVAKIMIFKCKDSEIFALDKEVEEAQKCYFRS